VATLLGRALDGDTGLDPSHYHCSKGHKSLVGLGVISENLINIGHAIDNQSAK
jgi:hypothetical protein